MNKNGEVDKDTIVKLRKPLTLPSGEIKTELSVDVDQLDWQALHNLEMEYNALFPGTAPTNGIFFTDTKYQAMMIARINGMIYDQIVKISARDALNLSNRLGRFLGEIASETSEDKSSLTPVPSEKS